MVKSVWAKSVWIALPLLTIVALTGCSTPPPPPAAPPLAPPPAEAPPPAPPGLPTASSDQDFINQAAGMGASEIGMGRLAQGKAAAKPVRALAARMLAAHSHANQQLAALAKRLKLEVAPPPDEPPPELLTSNGPDFDKQYLGLVVAGHQNMIALFESETKNGHDPRLKHFARSMLPVLRHHLHEAETIGQKLGG
jgi:putative membrane protein